MIEKMDSKNSGCARGSNPSSSPEDEDVVLVLGGSFKAVAGSQLQVWYSNLTSSNSEGVNPPDSQLFQKRAPVKNDRHADERVPPGVYTVVRAEVLRQQSVPSC